MEPIDFKEIAELLNNSNNIEFNPKPIKSDKNKSWDLYKGHYKIHGETLAFEVLYLHAKVTVESLNSAYQQAFTKDFTRVVYPASLDRRIKAHKEIFKEAKNLCTTKEYLSSFIAEELKNYSEKLKSRSPKFYINPNIDVPIGVTRKFPNPIIGALKDPRESGELIVLLAQPGQGKTFMSEYVVSKLAESDKDFFPIYINSEQWATMGPAEIGSLWKTITHSFRHMETPIGWATGREDIFVQTTLRAGLFCIVFDGFDEYILQNHGRVNAIEIIKVLSELATETSARILVTSRSTFWESEIDSQLDNSNKKSIAFSEYKMRAFDPNLARSYFTNRLVNGRQVNMASEMFSRLYSQEDEFIGRGFTLSLIADLFSDPDDIVPYDSTKHSPFMWLMAALCEREQRRQDLPINAVEQIKILSLFAAEIAQKEEPNQILLDFCIETVAPKLSPDARKNCMNNMAPHPLINLIPDSGQWDFTQKQVNVTFLANYLLNATEGEVAHFSNKADINDDFLSDVGIALVQLLNTFGDQEEDAEKLISRLLNPSDITIPEYIDSFDCLRRLAFIVAFRFVEASDLKEKLERTNLLLRLFPNNKLERIPFFGAIAKYDFSKVTFTRCKFDHVRWGNCKFGPETIFEHCNFIGTGSSNNCENFGLAKWNNLIADSEGQAFIDSQRILAGTKNYDLNDLKSDIDSVLKKFFVAGGLGFKKINVNHIATGHISTSYHKGQIIECLSQHVFSLKSNAGIAEKNYYEINNESQEAMRFFANNNVYTGGIKSAFKKLASDLCLNT
ncbi:NACHT domain-containing protein [Mariprofundus ferrooxydans]|uniref:Uncharacterized protein n=1 Tax=Mariprofundus ferrooxydans PV-1 TaxID=314345 RepID=Q0F3K9_9PROT|nr:NACHT domain-containing protein [Mariprofundus ferrooxydans]EAU55932.1 hypothetical protein SPV1_03908 [Mariprofundus ferrooxydans PV-1]KON48207.1 hypothetical protein AL013_04010 [Mariprofundus ferrooxydans]